MKPMRVSSSAAEAGDEVQLQLGEPAARPRGGSYCHLARLFGLLLLGLALLLAACKLVLLFSQSSPSQTPPLPLGATTGYSRVQSGNSSGAIFWWFIPPVDPVPAAKPPLLLWLQGGPGGSGIRNGLFQIVGPLRVTDGELTVVRTSWNEQCAVLYVDQPVGTGYSYTDSPNELSSYPHDGRTVSIHLHQVLQDFYGRGLWPRANKFIITGESYAGHYIPSLAAYILEQNRVPPGLETERQIANGLDLINLHGVAIGNGFTDPAKQVLTKPVTARAYGLIDESQYKQAVVLAANASRLAEAGLYLEAKAARDALHKLAKMSQINLYDVSTWHWEADGHVVAWLKSAQAKQRLGVPAELEFEGSRKFVSKALRADFMRSYSGLVPDLATGLPLGVLLYQGQFDWYDGPMANEAWINQLEWPGKAVFRLAERQVLSRAKDVPWGWGKCGGGLAWVVIAHAGHMAPQDQPEAALDMLTRWLGGRPCT